MGFLNTSNSFSFSVDGVLHSMTATIAFSNEEYTHIPSFPR